MTNNQTQPIIKLSIINHEFFQDIVSNSPTNPELIKNYAAANDSNELLAAAYNRLGYWLSGKKMNEVNEFINTLLDKFVIYHYTYKDDKEAYRVFNLLNNRGIELNESDHVKNFLFGEIERNQGRTIIDECDEVWEEIRATVTGKNHAKFKLDKFFHHYLLVTNGYSGRVSRRRLAR